MLGRVRISGASHVGARNKNNDVHWDYEAPDGHRLAVVCDGGGEKAGREAATTAVEAFIDRWKQCPTWTDPTHRLRQALAGAHESAGRRIEADTRRRDIRTTLVATEIDERKTHWISVGNSPLWHWSYANGRLRRLNDRNNTGMETIREIDEGSVTFSVGDMVVAASDGLNTLSAGELAEAIEAGRREDRGSVAAGLVLKTIAKARRDQDNVTALVIEAIAPES